MVQGRMEWKDWLGLELFPDARIVRTASRNKLRIAMLGLCLASLALVSAGHCAQKLPAGLVYLRTVDSTIVQDMRYATRFNFTGAPVPGYHANECILTRRVAEALARAQKELVTIRPDLTLKVFDCYRPVVAVSRFRSWVLAKEGSQRGYHHPDMARRDLIRLGYIAATSVHSRGNAVDLTIARSETAKATEQPTQAISCKGAISEREPDTGLDMGTAFDCFDPIAHTAAPKLPTEVRNARRMLVDLLARHGFKNYPREWWHFSFAGGRQGPLYDFPIVTLDAH